MPKPVPDPAGRQQPDAATAPVSPEPKHGIGGLASKIPAPRLLPMTIACLAALLCLKCAVLLQAAVTHGDRADSVIVATANAASTERAPEKAPERPQPQEHPKQDEKPAATAPKASAAAAPTEGPPPISVAERALLQDLRQRRNELDARAEAVTARELVLTATEQKLATRVNELQVLQKKLEGLDAAQKQKEETGWQGLVKLYETMKPKDAATIFNDLQMPVLLQVLDRMKDAKAAAVMAAMNPDRARDVTSALAQLRTGHDAADTPPAAAVPNSTGG